MQLRIDLGYGGERADDLLGETSQRFLQSQTASIDAGFDGADGTVDDFGYFLVRETIEVAQQDGFAELFG